MNCYLKTILKIGTIPDHYRGYNPPFRTQDSGPIESVFRTHRHRTRYAKHAVYRTRTQDLGEKYFFLWKKVFTDQPHRN